MQELERLEGSDMTLSEEDLGRLNAAFKKVMNGTMLESEYLALRDSIPGTTRIKNTDNETRNS